RAQRGDGGRELADGGQVQVDGGQALGSDDDEGAMPLPARGLPVPVPGGLEGDGGAHGLQDAADGVPGLGGGGGPVRDTDGPAGDRGGGEERGGVGQVRVDDPVNGEDRTRRDPPRGRGRLVDGDAGLAEHLQRHLDVRPGGDGGGTGVDQLGALVEPRGGEQQAGDELRGGGGVHLDAAAPQRAGAVDGERQAVPGDP